MMIPDNELYINQIREELNATGTDRGAAVLGGIIIEKSLQDLLLHVLVNDTQIKQFIENAQASLLKSIAYSIGLLSEPLFRDVGLILKIRNEFAHNFEVVSFDDSKVIGHIANLEAPKRWGKVNGDAVKTLTGKETAYFTDFPRKAQFIAAITGASATLQHIQNEFAGKFKVSDRFYIEPNWKK